MQERFQPTLVPCHGSEGKTDWITIIFEEEQSKRVGSSELAIFDQCLPASVRIRAQISEFLLSPAFDHVFASLSSPEPSTAATSSRTFH